MATLNRKYATLPDLDSAPDIYETPELTDDTSTIPTTINQAQSDDNYFGIEDDDDGQGISKSRLRIDEARSRFLTSNADASRIDFSDRVLWKRKSYKTSSHRRRLLEDGTYELGDLSEEEEEDGDDDKESLERKIARLRREVEEAKAEFAEQSRGTDAPDQGAAPSDTNLTTLSQALDEIAKPLDSQTAHQSRNIVHTTVPATNPEEASADGGITYTITYAPTYEQSHALAKAADFDRRLLALEKSLGISSSALTEADTNGLPRAVLPTLETLERQVSTLSQASTANLDAISRRVRTLASEQDHLNDSREKAKTLREELGQDASSSADDTDHASKIQALFGILPRIESLTPMLPPLLDRLRSLRVLHADAATAAQTLERIETQQVEMTGELKQWREGLEKVEKAMAEGGSLMKENVKVMEGWVKDLEQRSGFNTAMSTPKTPAGYFNLLYFAGVSSLTGKDHEHWPAPLPLAKLFSELQSKYPSIQTEMLDSCMVTVNLDYVDVPDASNSAGAMIQEYDEVAIIPPVSSG